MGCMTEEKNSFIENLCKTVFQVVCVDSYRPQIPPRWEGDKVKKTKSNEEMVKMSRHPTDPLLYFW